MRLFAFRLAKELGYANVDTMLANIPLSMLYEWLEYARREPFGEERADLRAGIIASVMANAWSGKGARRFKPSDFMPKFDGSSGRPKQTPQQMYSLLKGLSDLHKGHTQKQLTNADSS